MHVRYKCICMAEEATVQVRYRHDDEDVVHWIEQVVGRAIGEHHAAVSPLCRATTTQYIKLPLPAAAPYVGGKPVTH